MKSLKLISFLLLLLIAGVATAQTVPYGDNVAAGKFVTLNGVSVYFEIYGSGVPLLFIHGNSTPLRGWKPQIEHFSKKYKVIAMDCRGRGKSELGQDSVTYFQMASDAAALIKHLALDSVTVIGKSDGGIVGILMGIYFPEKINKIVAFGANMSPDTNCLYPETVNGIHKDRLMAEEMLGKKDTIKDWFMERQKQRLMEFQPHITAADLGKIKVPVLVMSCDRDVIKEEHTLFIYRSIPKANLSIFPGELHRVATLNPDLFNATVERFLEQPFKTNASRFE